MHMVHGLAMGQEMSMEKFLAPHLFEESKYFLGRNLPRHTNDQGKKQRGGGGECRLCVFLIWHLALSRSVTDFVASCSPASCMGHVRVMSSISRLPDRVIVRLHPPKPSCALYLPTPGDHPHGKEAGGVFNSRPIRTTDTSIRAYKPREI